MSKQLSVSAKLRKPKGSPLRNRRLSQRPVSLRQVQRLPRFICRARVVDLASHILTLAARLAVQLGLADQATVEFITSGLAAIVGFFCGVAPHTNRLVPQKRGKKRVR